VGCVGCASGLSGVLASACNPVTAPPECTSWEGASRRRRGGVLSGPQSSMPPHCRSCMVQGMHGASIWGRKGAQEAEGEGEEGPASVSSLMLLQGRART
jgi:hypothetical protein